MLRAMGMGQRIRAERELKGWTQTYLVAQAANGVTQQNLDVMERRDSNKSEYVVGIADALGVSVRWLITGRGNKDEGVWPFPRVDRERWEACNGEDRGYVQAALNRALDECEAQRDKRQIAR